MVEPGLLAGRYRIERRLASGGMGTVHLAEDRRLGRKVALKLLEEELAADPDFVARFEREARAAAALSHPNIASVFDFGEDEGRPFIAMEYIAGRDLTRLLDQQASLEPGRAVAIACSICDALAHAHSAGIVHGDVKPANVIIGDDGRVKLTDFGIARARGHTTLTAAGSVIGTGRYSAPEQVGGKAVGPETDLYSLGVVLFEMLTGSVPFGSESPSATARQLLTEDVPPPSARTEGIPLALEEVVIRATARQREHRFQDAETMGAALRAILESDQRGGAGALPNDFPVVPAATLPGTASPPTQATKRPLPLLPGGRYDPERLGRIVLASFIVLALVALGAFLWRLRSGADDQPSPRSGEQAVTGATDAGTVTVPDVVGMEFSSASEVIRELGLDPVRRIRARTGSSGIVFDQRPDRGTQRAEGERVILFVGRGEGDGEE